MTTRRRVLAWTAAAPLMLQLRPAAATPETMRAAVEAFTGGAAMQEGGVVLKIPLLVESGNAVPMTVSVDSPMTEDDHVAAIAVFNEANPLPEVVTFHFTPRSGRAEAETRIRLSATQNVHAVARMSDGSFRHAVTDVIVTAPACVES
jgi:sulfur-oxidizing protein SoxY